MDGPITEITIGAEAIQNHPIFQREWSQETSNEIDKTIRGKFKKYQEQMNSEIPPEIPKGASSDHLADSFKSDPISGKGINLTAVWGTGKKYAAWHEWGTRPHWPPIAALMPWVIAKGTFVDKKGQTITASSPPYIIRGAAFMVARAISRRGTIPGNERERWLQKNEVKITREIIDTLDDLMTKAILGTI